MSSAFQLAALVARPVGGDSVALIQAPGTCANTPRRLRSKFGGRQLQFAAAPSAPSFVAERTFSVSAEANAPIASDKKEVSQAVESLYDVFPYPPEPILDGPPPGYNFRWHYESAYAFCYKQLPPRRDRPVRILDAGCGTGNCADFLAHLNPSAAVTAVDLSSGALKVARERWTRSGVSERIESHHMSLCDVAQLVGDDPTKKFDYINCVGVLHHLPDPVEGLRALESVLAPGGVMHIFVYAELGRHEIALMQKAIALLQGEKRGDFVDGVDVGRRLFKALPKENRLRVREETRWAMENKKDETFADMYVHPQEVDYNVETLFEFVGASKLDFLGFSNPDAWEIKRLVGADAGLLERFEAIQDPRKRYRLIELLDPEAVTHFEFFLGQPPAPALPDWSSDALLAAAVPELSACMHGWPSNSLMDYDYRLVTISEAQRAFMAACEAQTAQAPISLFGPGGVTGAGALREVDPAGRRTVAELAAESGASLADVRSLVDSSLVLLSPAN
eukprot:tig00001525_g9235.t1